ncbi:hypothetical protein ACEE21_15175 [Clostridium baratii]
MKKVAIGLIVVAVLGSVGFTSYKLVDFAKSKSQDKIVSKNTETDKSVQTNTTPSVEKEVENSNEISSESTSNNGASSSSDSGNIVFNTTNSSKGLDFTSADAFILSYNNLIENVGSKTTKEDVYSETHRSRMTFTSVGNLLIEAYQYDGQIARIIIKEKDKIEDLEGYLGGKAKVKFEDGNTIIYDILYN